VRGTPSSRAAQRRVRTAEPPGADAGGGEKQGSAGRALHEGHCCGPKAGEGRTDCHELSDV